MNFIFKLLLLLSNLSFAKVNPVPGLEALKSSGDLMISENIEYCGSDLIGVVTTDGMIICLERKKLPEAVEKEISEMLVDQYINEEGASPEQGMADYRITKMELLVGLGVPDDVIQNKPFLEEIVHVFSVPIDTLTNESEDLFNFAAVEDLNLPPFLSLAGTVWEIEDSATGQFILTTTQNWSGQHLVLNKSVVGEEQTTYFEYHFIFSENRLLFFKVVWFEA